jgi:fructose/tagatose bisphosphate aldolase
MTPPAAAREGVRGPVFLQADHVTVDADDPASVAQARAHLHDALDAGFAQLDVDAAALATHAADPAARQARNAAVTAELAAWVRARRPDAVIGGEVGEIGGADTHPDDLRAFLTAFARNPRGAQLGKVSVQTGTPHGGVVHADGRSGVMRVDHALAAQLATIARREFGLPGVVQHGASTLTPEQWRSLPAAGVIEVHLATGIQNVILDHPALPAALTDAMQAALVGPVMHAERGSDTAEALTRAQVYRHNRWRAWGTFKRELWSLPEAVWTPIDAALEAWFATTFTALGVAGRAEELARIPAPA